MVIIYTKQLHDTGLMPEGNNVVVMDPKDVDATVKAGMVISGGIDFKDKQSTKSPQIGVGALN